MVARVFCNIIMHVLRNLIRNSVFNVFIRCRHISSAKNVNRKPILYGDEISPPVRFVLMTASILGVELNFHKIDLFKREHKSEYYKKINPLQKVPALVTKSVSICDSHAITMYLCQLTADNGVALYPADPIVQAEVNQLLFYNSSTLFRLDSEILTMFFAGNWPPSDEKLEEWNVALDYLENRLESKSWLAGDKMLLCDICIVTVVTSVIPLLPITKRHTKVNYWINQFENVPCYRINQRGLSTLYSYIESFKIKYNLS